jgi:hypothetical protein
MRRITDRSYDIFEGEEPEPGLPEGRTPQTTLKDG